MIEALVILTYVVQAVAIVVGLWAAWTALDRYTEGA